MNTVVINLENISGPVVAKVTCPQFPQSIAGIIWRYNADQTPDKRSGNFTTQLPEVPLGTAGTIAEKFFLVEGAVLQQNDTPPTPYQVIVSIIQNGNLIHQEIPESGGTGQLSDKNKAFVYLFNFKTN
jgi:hypothetical protein